MALRTDNVMMVRMMIGMFEARETVPKVNLTGDVARRQSLEGAENSYYTDSLVLLFHERVQVLDTQMTLGVQEGRQNQVLLVCLFQAVLAQIGVEKLHFFSEILSCHKMLLYPGATATGSVPRHYCS